MSHLKIDLRLLNEVTLLHTCLGFEDQVLCCLLLELLTAAQLLVRLQVRVEQVVGEGCPDHLIEAAGCSLTALLHVELTKDDTHHIDSLGWLDLWLGLYLCWQLVEVALPSVVEFDFCGQITKCLHFALVFDDLRLDQDV